MSESAFLPQAIRVCFFPLECQDTFEAFSNTLTYGGHYVVNVTSFPDCLESCRNAVNCAAFDWNDNNNNCYIHNDGYELNVRKTDARHVTQYRRVPCLNMGFSGKQT